MENNNLLDQGIPSSNNEGLSPDDKNYLNTAARWSKFLGIVGFVLTGIIVLASFAIMSMGNSLFSGFGGDSPFGGMGIAAGIIYIGFGAIYFFISLYLYRFGTKIQSGLNSSSSVNITEGFKNLKGFFQLSGIIAIVILVLYLLIFIFGIGAAAFARY